MTLTTIVVLIILGIGLIILELLVVPGTTVVGVLGFLMLATGIWLTYDKYGSGTGHLVMAASVALTALMTWYAFRANTWKRVSVNSAVDGRVNVVEEDSVKPGDRGIAVSRLSPMGKARINGKYFEVQSFEGYVTENTDIQVVKIEGNKIIVKTTPPA